MHIIVQMADPVLVGVYDPRSIVSLMTLNATRQCKSSELKVKL